MVCCVITLKTQLIASPRNTAAGCGITLKNNGIIPKRNGTNLNTRGIIYKCSGMTSTCITHKMSRMSYPQSAMPRDVPPKHRGKHRGMLQHLKAPSQVTAQCSLWSRHTLSKEIRLHNNQFWLTTIMLPHHKQNLPFVHVLPHHGKYL